MKLRKTPDLERLFRQAERYEEAGDSRNAFRRLSTAARLGHVASQVNLGNFYAWGRGVRRNLKMAAYWYKKAYKNGDRDAAHNLGIDRRNMGNVRSAVAWFRKAVDMNNGEACVALAKIYGDRKGGRKAATELLRRALRLSKDNISDAAKEEAASLLKEIESARNR